MKKKTIITFLKAIAMIATAGSGCYLKYQIFKNKSVKEIIENSLKKIPPRQQKTIEERDKARMEEDWKLIKDTNNKFLINQPPIIYKVNSIGHTLLRSNFKLLEIDRKIERDSAKDFEEWKEILTSRSLLKGGNILEEINKLQKECNRLIRWEPYFSVELLRSAKIKCTKKKTFIENAKDLHHIPISTNEQEIERNYHKVWKERLDYINSQRFRFKKLQHRQWSNYIDLAKECRDLSTKDFLSIKAGDDSWIRYFKFCLISKTPQKRTLAKKINNYKVFY